MPTYPTHDLPIDAAVRLAHMGAGDDARWHPVIDAAAAWLRAQPSVTLDDSGRLIARDLASPLLARVAARLVVRALEVERTIREAAQHRRLLDAIAAARREVRRG
jgi:hypothetical protein